MMDLTKPINVFGLLLVLFAVVQISDADLGQQRVPRITLTDCQIPNVEGTVKCGEYEVFENRATRKGRKIKLKIVVFPATG